MKSFIAASFLALASASGAASAGNTETLVFTSSPQQCSNLDRTACKFQPDNAIAFQNTKDQFQWLSTNMSSVLGVIVNGDLTSGDLTSSGSHNELKLSNELFAILNNAKIPYYFGLGANDLSIAQGCKEERCAIGNVMRLVNHVSDLKNQSVNNGRAVNFDFTQRDGFGRQFTNTTDVIGSLGYAVDMGKVYYIQLNNNDLKEDMAFSNYVSEIKNGLTLKTYNIHLTPVLDWLEATLEYAAQQGKVIVVNKYDANEDAGVNALLDKYHVQLRFSGQPAINPAQSKFISQGFSFQKEFLKLDLNYDQGSYKVVNVKDLDLTQQADVTVGQLVKHPTFYPLGQYPKRNTVIVVKNSGTYVGRTTVEYKDPTKNPDEQDVKIVSRNMLKWNVFTANVPKQAVGVKVMFDINYVFAWKSFFGPNQGFENIERYNAPVLCVDTYGDIFFDPITYTPDIRTVKPYFNTQTQC